MAHLQKRCLYAYAGQFLFLAGCLLILVLSVPWRACHDSRCARTTQIASGDVFGPNQPIILQMLGSERSFEALEGVAMELEDSLFPLLRQARVLIASTTAAISTTGIRLAKRAPAGTLSTACLINFLLTAPAAPCG